MLIFGHDTLKNSSTTGKSRKEGSNKNQLDQNKLQFAKGKIYSFFRYFKSIN